MTERRARHLKESHSDFRSIEVQTQIVHSRFDQALFGEEPRKERTTDVFERLHRDASVPFAAGTHWHSRFGHLVSYGAGYYGYLYAQVFAADMWARCMSANVNNSNSQSTLREGGIKIWKDMLIHGGSKNPKEMLQVVLGREPSVEPFFDEISDR